MIALRNKTGIPPDLAERFDIPQEAVPGSEKISVNAGRHVLIEEYGEVQKYGENRIVVGLKRGKLILSGSGLYLVAMNRHELLIGGKLQSMEWI